MINTSVSLGTDDNDGRAARRALERAAPVGLSPEGEVVTVGALSAEAQLDVDVTPPTVEEDAGSMEVGTSDDGPLGTSVEGDDDLAPSAQAECPGQAMLSTPMSRTATHTHTHTERAFNPIPLNRL